MRDSHAHAQCVRLGMSVHAQRRLYFRFKLNTKETFLGNFLMIDGRFNYVTSRVKVLGLLEKKKEQFWILTVSGRPPQNSFWTLLVLL